MMSRVIVDELRTLEAKRREDVADADELASRCSRRRYSLSVDRHAELIQVHLMIELDYELPDLDEMLLGVSRNPNPHRERLREQVQWVSSPLIATILEQMTFGQRPSGTGGTGSNRISVRAYRRHRLTASQDRLRGTNLSGVWCRKPPSSRRLRPSLSPGNHLNSRHTFYDSYTTPGEFLLLLHPLRR